MEYQLVAVGIGVDCHADADASTEHEPSAPTAADGAVGHIGANSTPTFTVVADNDAHRRRQYEGIGVGDLLEARRW